MTSAKAHYALNVATRYQWEERSAMAAFTSRVVRVADPSPQIHDYGICRSAWIRGMALMNRFGSERALDLADQRAERAFDRGNIAMCRRWRDLMVAIHAVEMDELGTGERTH